MINFVEELKWRGMIHDMTPGVENQMNSGMTTAYIGFDPTADSLHVGSLVQIMILVHLQRCGHQPIVLVGGATGMVGDPSGKSAERNLLSREVLEHNIQGIRQQLERFLVFDKGENAAEIVNNFDWFREFSFLDFIREVGKHIPVNYMLSKESVQKRLETGMSFTEFSYQLIQGYDFLWLYSNKDCKVQLGGSDQWGNIVTGTELIRRKVKGEAYAITTPLLKKVDGTKFGKTEDGNVWLDPEKTSPYKFYQFWRNTRDEDAENFIKFFSLRPKDEILELIQSHKEDPGQARLQKALAEELTTLIHSKEELDLALRASAILFGRSTTEELASLDERSMLSILEGVPTCHLSTQELAACETIVDLLSDATGGTIFASKGEVRRMIKNGGVSVNKEKILDPASAPTNTLLQGKYLLAQKGKKDYYLIVVN